MKTRFNISEGKCSGDILVKMQDIYGKGPEYPQIIIPIEISCEAPKENVFITLVDMKGEVIVIGKEKTFTIAHIIENTIFKIKHERAERRMLLKIPIDFWCLEKIEQKRADDLQLNIDCNINYMIWNANSKQTDFSSTNANLSRITIPQSNWIKILKNTGFTNLKILEIPYPEIIGDEKFDMMVNHLDEAKDFFYKGDYESAVGECRNAIEPIPSLLPIEKIREDGKDPTFNEKLKQFCNQHIKSEIGKEKIKMLADIIWRFSSIFHHPSSSKPLKIVSVDRADAEFVIHTVSGIIAYLGKILSKKKK